MAENIAVSPDYFRVLGTPLVEGRAFTDLDKAGADFVGLVDRAAAARFWPGESAIGKRIKFGRALLAHADFVRSRNGEGRAGKIAGVARVGQQSRHVIDISLRQRSRSIPRGAVERFVGGRRCAERLK